MQLFHIEHTTQNWILTVTDKETIEQCRKVMRLKIGDLIHVQFTLANTTTRHLIKITELSNKLLWSIIESSSKDISSEIQNTCIMVAMSNKWDKIELITQKLTEIGIAKILFRPGERSVIKERNKNKAIRLQKIVKEATEQSRWRFIPEINYREHPEDRISDENIIIFDKKESETKSDIFKWKWKTIGIIGPEWWLGPKDYDRFNKYHPQIYTLWENVLRTETAAIIWWRLVKNK